MKKIIVLLSIFLFSLSLFAQKKSWVDILEMEQGLSFEKIIDSKIDSVKKAIKEYGEDLDEEAVNFGVDTFRIEEFGRLFWKHHGSTVATIQILHWKKNQYESMNLQIKKKLLKLLKKEDKIFIEANEKAWQNYKNNQIELIGRLSDSKYIGRGTIRGIQNGEYILRLVQERAVQLFSLYYRVEESQITEE